MVDDDRAGLDDLRLAERGPAEERPDAGTQLDIEVARDDVVGAALEPADADDRVRVRLGEQDQRDVPVPAPTRLAGPDPPAQLRLA